VDSGLHLSQGRSKWRTSVAAEFYPYEFQVPAAIGPGALVLTEHSKLNFYQGG
jgi:hypothetical protein